MLYNKVRKAWRFYQDNECDNDKEARLDVVFTFISASKNKIVFHTSNEVLMFKPGYKRDKAHFRYKFKTKAKTIN